MEYVCTVCSYAYDEDSGETELMDITPGTKFDELPECFVCPVCGTKKSAFEAPEIKDSELNQKGTLL